MGRMQRSALTKGRTMAAEMETFNGHAQGRSEAQVSVEGYLNALHQIIADGGVVRSRDDQQQCVF